MTSIKASLVWAIPVSVDVLGAHLQAYAELQPILNTLRLCNRFGKGDHAVVSQLPIELVNAIEEYLLETSCAKLRQQWTASFKCWANRCSPADHITPDERVGLYFNFFDGMDGLEYNEEEDEFVFPTELNDTQLEDLNEALWDTDDNGRPYQRVHEERKEDWLAKTGAPTAVLRGIFSKLAALTKKHFGLEIHVSHTQLHERGELMEEDERRFTLAYLTLPGYAKFQRSLGRLGESPHYDFCCEDGPHRLYDTTENGIALPVAIPSQISKESLARFTRALKILRLSPMCEDGAKHPTMSASGIDPSPNMESTGGDESGCSSRPQLTFIMRVDDIPSDYF